MANPNPGFASKRNSVSNPTARPTTAVVVTIEGLGTNLVGAYGNAITPTPHLDRFASRGLVCDQFWMDGCVPHRILASMWQGIHGLVRMGHPPGASRGGPGKLGRCIESPGLLVTDSPEAMQLAKSMLDGEAVLATPPAGNQTALGSLVEQAIEQWLPVLDSMPWLWIHSRGLLGPWDAPYAYRCSMCDEGDPLPPEGIDPPFAKVDKNTDPDVIFGWACGAGAQAMVVDEVWEWMESALEQLDLAPSCLVTLAGVLGYPLGEHGTVGWPPMPKQVTAPKSEREDPHFGSISGMGAESLHTPLILRPGNHLPLGVRFSPFLQPHHLGQLINAWIERDGWSEAIGDESAVRGDSPNIEALVAMSSLRREAWPAEFRGALATHGHHHALLVPSWGATWHGTETDESSEESLYAMPDDRWQQNEVSSRASEILEQMRALRDAWIAESQNTPSNIGSVLSRMDSALWRPQR